MSEDMLAGVSIFLLSVAAFTGGYFGYHAGYRDGQVDAINGKITFKLEQQKDGTTDWRKVK